jgi:Domain of unknown function DUF29
MAVKVKSLYDVDFFEWTAHMAELLRAGRFDELDIENLAEEIEDLGKRDRKAVRSQLVRMLMHMIKQQVQPERDGSSWRASIVNARLEIQQDIEDSPSLRRDLENQLARIYTRAVNAAIDEMQLPPSKAAQIPRECPYTLAQLLDEPKY